MSLWLVIAIIGLGYPANLLDGDEPKNKPIDAETNNAYLKLGAEIINVKFDGEASIPGFKFLELKDGKLPKLPEVKVPFVLDLRNTKLTDEGLKKLKDLKNITYLELSGTKVTDKGLKELKDLKNLTILELRDTKVTETGRKELKEALPKCSIIR
jgi:Leucine-rich repeat (LRR) protein